MSSRSQYLQRLRRKAIEADALEDRLTQRAISLDDSYMTNLAHLRTRVEDLEEAHSPQSHVEAQHHRLIYPQYYFTFRGDNGLATLFFAFNEQATPMPLLGDHIIVYGRRDVNDYVMINNAYPSIFNFDEPPYVGVDAVRTDDLSEEDRLSLFDLASYIAEHTNRNHEHIFVIEKDDQGEGGGWTTNLHRVDACYE